MLHALSYILLQRRRTLTRSRSSFKNPLPWRGQGEANDITTEIFFRLPCAVYYTLRYNRTADPHGAYQWYCGFFPTAGSISSAMACIIIFGRYIVKKCSKSLSAILFQLVLIR